MICLVLLVAVFGLATSAPTEDLPVLGIVGGERANQPFLNFQISLEYSGRHSCGGTLVTPSIVVTAAHCTYNTPTYEFRVRVGSAYRNAGGQIYAVAQIVNHPNYNENTVQFDVAVIKLIENVTLSKTVGTLQLAETEPEANSAALVSGWIYTQEGVQLSYYLQFAKITIFDRQYCGQRVRLTNEMICGGRVGGGVDSCQADSGGPLYANRRLVGIVSLSEGCGRPGKPGVYSNVAVLKPWIDETIIELSNTKTVTDNDKNGYPLPAEQHLLNIRRNTFGDFD